MLLTFLRRTFPTGGAWSKSQVQSQQTASVLKMKDPLSTCCYNKLYQDVKQLSKAGECFCKDLMTVFQQRAELELTYAKGLQKLAGKLMRTSKGMSHNSTYSAWCHLSDEMYSRADAHRSLGNAFQQEAILEIRQLLDEHTKRKRPFDGAIDRTGKLVTLNWNEQLKVKKKLSALTREHEALFNFVEENKQICTEKEKQKMLNRLTKSAEVQTQVDDEYFKINMEGHQMRLKLENTLKNCHQVCSPSGASDPRLVPLVLNLRPVSVFLQILQELEKQRIEVLCNILNRYHLQMTSFGQTLKHGHRRIEQAVQRVDMDKDMRALVEQNRITTEDTTTEFLMADYFEEDSKSLMDKDRRRQAIRVKVQRLSDSITRARKDQEGVEKLMRTYSGNPSFSNQKNLEETEQQLDECSLKLDLLRATHYKLSAVLSELEGTPRPRHPVRNISIRRWKDKDSEHSVVQLTRPVKLRRTPFRSRQSLRASIIYKGAAPLAGQQPLEAEPSDPAATQSQTGAAACGATLNGAPPSSGGDETPGGARAEPGRCRALYSFTSQQQDQLSMREGDLLDVHTKGDAGWWFGGLNGKTGHFPSSYVEELPAPNQVQLPDSAADSGQS
ncbi:nostrin [Takifugu flavidus]|uniref:nostrin n=1 Tax=Takifugu flavidus TaxID=433684 RepID=UPI002544541C|nr:nostrin [Takifugu flavidus]